jgi:hypothetical protein
MTEAPLDAVCTTPTCSPHVLTLSERVETYP